MKRFIQELSCTLWALNFEWNFYKIYTNLEEISLKFHEIFINFNQNLIPLKYNLARFFILLLLLNIML